MRRIALVAAAMLFSAVLPLRADVPAALPAALKDGVLAFGGDAEGGAPYTFYDPANPRELIGFEVDIVNEIARRLGVRAEFRQNAWESLVPALNRGDSDIVINGLEVTPGHAAEAAFTRPYYVFQQQLTVRTTETAIRTLDDLKGKKVGTLMGALAMQILNNTPGVQVVNFPDDVAPYQDLAVGRIDAVLLDGPLAQYHTKGNTLVRPVGLPIGEGLYAIAVRKSDPELLSAVDRVLGGMIADGTVHSILVKWELWNDAQNRLADGGALLNRYLSPGGSGSVSAVNESAVQAASETVRPVTAVASEKPASGGLVRYLPQLMAGAGVTVGISVVSMAIAVGLGLLVALARLYGAGWLQTLATAYVEIIRGTPLLIQLYLLYYGLPGLGVRLPALVAAVIGLGLNYAAYEAEIYRAGILALPRGQTEAAQSLGMTRLQTIIHVLIPQALRTVLPPVTNDFIAMLKDSSLVSVITVVELTKAYSIQAASTFSYLELGLVTAAIYLLMSLPLARLSRYLEARTGFAY